METQGKRGRTVFKEKLVALAPNVSDEQADAMFSYYKLMSAANREF